MDNQSIWVSGGWICEVPLYIYKSDWEGDFTTVEPQYNDPHYNELSVYKGNRLYLQLTLTLHCCSLSTDLRMQLVSLHNFNGITTQPFFSDHLFANLFQSEQLTVVSKHPCQLVMSAEQSLCGSAIIA